MYLITFKKVQFAQTFTDYMALQGITIRSETDAEGNRLLFIDNVSEETIEHVKNELSQYLENPYDERYMNAAWQAGEKNNFHVNKSFISQALPKIIAVGPVTIIITIICVIVYILSLLISYWQVLAYIGYPDINTSQQFWRYFTPVFIHFSLLHITFNLMWWWYLGGMVEKQKGAIKLIEILLLSGVLSNYAQAIVSGPVFGGLSGVVYALMGYVWLYGEKVKTSGLYLERALMGFAIVWLIAGYIGILANIANTAHLVGLIIGLLLAAKDIWIIKK